MYINNFKNQNSDKMLSSLNFTKVQFKTEKKFIPIPPISPADRKDFIIKRKTMRNFNFSLQLGTQSRERTGACKERGEEELGDV